MSSPIPSTAGQRLVTACLVAALAGTGWWALGESDTLDWVATRTRQVFRAAGEIEGSGGALAPSASSAPVSASAFTQSGGGGGGLPATGAGTTGGGTTGGGTTGAATGRDARRRGGDGDRSRSVRAMLFGGGADSEASRPDTTGQTGRDQGGQARPEAQGIAAPSDPDVRRPTGGVGDTLASAMRRASDALVGGPSRGRGRGAAAAPVLPAPLLP